MNSLEFISVNVDNDQCLEREFEKDEIQQAVFQMGSLAQVDNQYTQNGKALELQQANTPRHRWDTPESKNTPAQDNV